MISPHGTHDSPHGTEHPHGTQDIPHIYHDIPHGTEHPHSTQDIPHGTEHPTVLNTPTVLTTPHDTAHTLYRVFLSDFGLTNGSV